MIDLYDCIVIGAGPAGHSAALFLARYRRHALVFHHNSPRNLYSHGVHGFLGRHGILPVDLLARGRDEVRIHGGLIVEGRVTKAERVEDDHFRVTVGEDGGASASQTFDARRLLLATGLRDVKPDLPGFSEFYGLSVFHCPDCDGYEVSDKRVAVLGAGRKAVAFTLGLLTWTDRLTLITGDGEEEIGDEDREKLASFDIPVLDRSVFHNILYSQRIFAPEPDYLPRFFSVSNPEKVAGRLLPATDRDCIARGRITTTAEPTRLSTSNRTA